MDGTEYIAAVENSFNAHENFVIDAFGRLDVVQDTLAEIQRDLDIGVTKKPKVTVHTAAGDPKVTVHIKLASGACRTSFMRSGLRSFLRSSSENIYSFVSGGISDLFESRFTEKVGEFCCLCGVTISSNEYLWDRVSKDQAQEVLLRALRMIDEKDLDNTDKQRIHEQRILFGRIRKTLAASLKHFTRDRIGWGKEDKTTKADIPARDDLVNLILDKPIPASGDKRKQLFIDYYSKHINPNKTRWSQEKKYRQVDYELTVEDAEMLANEFLVQQTMTS